MTRAEMKAMAEGGFNKVSIGVSVTPKVKEQIKEEALALGMTVSKIVENLVENYLASGDVAPEAKKAEVPNANKK